MKKAIIVSLIIILIMIIDTDIIRKSDTSGEKLVEPIAVGDVEVDVAIEDELDYTIIELDEYDELIVFMNMKPENNYSVDEIIENTKLSLWLLKQNDNYKDEEIEVYAVEGSDIYGFASEVDNEIIRFNEGQSFNKLKELEEGYLLNK